MSIHAVYQTDPDDPANAVPTEPDPEWDAFTQAVRNCLVCRRLGQVGEHDDLPLLCGTHDRLLDEIIVPYSLDIEASEGYAALCREMGGQPWLTSALAVTGVAGITRSSLHRRSSIVKRVMPTGTSPRPA